jgi:biopolymer transport protein ExbD
MGGVVRGVSSEINVTPLIDVLLVLIIIFMVVQPQQSQGLDALVPQPPRHSLTDPPPPETTIVVQVLTGVGGSPLYKINGRTFAKSDLTAELTRLFSTRQDRVMFVKGEAGLPFGLVAEAIGFGKAANAASIGILTPQVEAGR